MAPTEKFCLKCNDFYSNLGSALQEIRLEGEFYDVTLASEDEQIQAHKVILSACSPFFRSVLKKNKHDHPLVYLKGVKFSELMSVINFMYNGEVNIKQEDLSSFLAVAEDLKIKGLSQNSEGGGEVGSEGGGEVGEVAVEEPASQSFKHQRSNSFSNQRLNYSSPPPPPKRSRPNHVKPVNLQTATKQAFKEDSLVKCEPGVHKIQDAEDDVEPVVGVEGGYVDGMPSTGNSETALTLPSQQDASGYLDDFPLEEYEGQDDGDNQISDCPDGQQLSNTEILKDSRDAFFRLVEPLMESVVGETGKVWVCKACTHTSRTKQHIMNHVEMKHSEGPGYSCPLCNVHVPSYQALHKHFSRNHNPKKKDAGGFNSIQIHPSAMQVEYLDYSM